jgi:Transposase zinc-binding domain
MSRPTLEVADLIRAQGDHFLDRYRSSFSFQQLKAFRAIRNCRTAALGGHLDSCSRCGHQVISYNSCRNRHCPKCQTQARQRWLAAREQEVLPTAYFHVVFSVPHELNVLALENPRCFYDLLFAAASATLLEVAANPKRLGADIGVIAILHTCRSETVCEAAPANPSPALGGLRQSPFRRPDASAAVSRPLYPSRRHFESPPHRF